MDFPTIFDKEVTAELIRRIDSLTPSIQPQWRKMSVAQMLAHCNVAYEIAYEKIIPNPIFSWD
ncbi:hypothetical protein [Cyclobacterium jeungdonense]|uniref:DinB family protein n=1 Tax=Cyclobacterium jeungdonense TaxID=708087 RepID=A0ABT8C0M2_9BACT|nr:hypothetical protein [Cyclobacterium jeungdonense]MDN3686348.1 hypothetical protein [Cyclobacterium jeungdonense]